MKHYKDALDWEELGSPLTQGRGLKLVSLREALGDAAVAPHTGAWIETRLGMLSVDLETLSPLTQGRGLKHWEDLKNLFGTSSSPLTQGRGLKL